MKTQLNESPAADVAKQHFFDPVVDISPIFSPSHPTLACHTQILPGKLCQHGPNPLVQRVVLLSLSIAQSNKKHITYLREPGGGHTSRILVQTLLGKRQQLDETAATHLFP